MKQSNEALFLPKGSVRAIIILLITTYIILSTFYEKVVLEQVITVWAGAVGWYFAGKNSNSNNNIKQ